MSTCSINILFPLDLFFYCFGIYGCCHPCFLDINFSLMFVLFYAFLVATVRIMQQIRINTQKKFSSMASNPINICRIKTGSHPGRWYVRNSDSDWVKDEDVRNANCCFVRSAIWKRRNVLPGITNWRVDFFELVEWQGKSVLWHW